MNVDLKIFKDYDIRGTYPDQMNAEVARALAHAIVRKFAPKSVVIGRDMRLSGEEIRDAIVDVFVRLGIDVFDMGLVGTEMMSFAAGSYPYDLVIMLSASHNPPEYNGMKMTRKGAVPVSADTGLRDIRDLIAKGPLPDAPQKGTSSALDVYPDWKKKVLSLVDLPSLKALKVVVDAGNGMAGKLVPALLDGLPLQVTSMYMELDGSFPNHTPNPLIEKNNADLVKKILEIKGDVGLTFDGDADRIFLIDDKGRFVSGTVTTAILAKLYLQRFPGATILYNAICGRIVPETIEKFGGKSKRVRVGYSYIKAAMKETGAVFCGEHSGHYFHKDYFNSESGGLTALMVLNLLSQEGRKLSSIVDELNIYPASGEINFVVSDIPVTVEAIKTGFPAAQSVDELDGVSVWYPSYWFNVRASKTEPLLRLNVEANTKEILEQKTNEVVGMIEKLGGKRK
jgi:phosphomannomutase